MRRPLLAAIATLAIVDVAMLVGVRRDRTSDDVAYLTLDERELRLVPADREDSVVTLRFAALHGGREPQPTDVQPPWITRADLAQLGFDVATWPADPRGAARDRAWLARPATVAFDLGTGVWSRRVADWSERMRARALAAGEAGATDARDPADVESDIAAVVERTSRLAPIEVGRDGGALRGKYRARPSTLILAAVIGVDVDDGTRPHSRVELRGRVVEVHPRTLVVPAHLRAVFTDLPSLPQRPGRSSPVAGTDPLPHLPRYDVTIAIGPALRPWVVDARRLGR